MAILTCFQALHIGEVVAIIIGLHHGIGRTQSLLRQSDVAEASKVSTSIPRLCVDCGVDMVVSQAAFAAQILFILAAAALKAATLYLMMRLFNLSGSKVQNQTRSRLLYWTSLVLLGLMAIWGVMSIIAISVDCSVPGFIEADNAQCSNQV